MSLDVDYRCDFKAGRKRWFAVLDYEMKPLTDDQLALFPDGYRAGYLDAQSENPYYEDCGSCVNGLVPELLPCTECGRP